MSSPTLSDLITFVRNVAGIPAAYLPDSSLQFQHALDNATNTVNLDLISALSRPTSWSPYALAVLNLSTHLLIEYAIDQSYGLSGLSWAAGTVSATTSAPHLIQPGNRLTISGVSPLGYSGSVLNGVQQNYVVVQAVPDSTHFTYSLAKDPGASTLLSGAAAIEQYFSNARRQLKIGAWVPGVVTSANDVSTGTGLLNPDFMRGLTIENLDLLKTQFGRSYLSLAQKYGPSAWGVT